MPANIAPAGPQPVILIYDPIRDYPWDYGIERRIIEARGGRLIVPGHGAEARALLPVTDLLIVSRHLPQADMDLLDRCCAILCYGAGMDSVDSAYAAQLGIEVANVADYCWEEVSDHAVALLLSLQRLIVPAAAAAAAGIWDVWSWPAWRSVRRLRGQSVGIVGFGRVGRAVAAKVRALGMVVSAYDPYLGRAPDDTPLLGLRPLLECSDAVVLCAPLTGDSRKLMNKETLAWMRPASLLVNVARGALVDERALAGALRSGPVRGAALDVRDPEPPDPSSDPLRALPNVVLTQHVAATSAEADAQLHLRAAERALELLERAGRLSVA